MDLSYLKLGNTYMEYTGMAYGANSVKTNGTRISQRNNRSNSEEVTETLDFRTIISSYKRELYEKIRNDEAEPKFQIGAQAFTEKEWDDFIEQIDDIQDEMRQMMREEVEERNREEKWKNTEK